MPEPAQSLQSHAKFDPKFHFFLVPGSLVILGYTVYCMIVAPSLHSAVELFAALWLIVAMFTIRLYSLKVQDRVIRLEEQTRLARLSGGTAPELTVDQYIGIRFASDAEAVALAQKAASSRMSRKEIKAAIQNWRPDHWRV